MIFDNAQEAFEFYYDKINNYGQKLGNTKCLMNVGFEILYPTRRSINTPGRKFNEDYAEYEWQWYLSGDRSAIDISKRAKIWESCMDAEGEVNSNYGWHWKQGDQLGYVIRELRENPDSRRASISIYNAKDRWNFTNDTPCTYAINFYVRNNTLNMSVMMRSNDLWYGFCNDQYCFSKLQEMVAKELELEVGTYFHFVNNLHLYDGFTERELY